MGSNAHLTAKRVANTKAKISSAAVSTFASSKQRMAKLSQLRPFNSSYTAMQKILDPNRWRKPFIQMKRCLLVYGSLSVASLMAVNQMSYMALLYLIRHRYDENNKVQLFGMDMVWIHRWLNI